MAFGRTWVSVVGMLNWHADAGFMYVPVSCNAAVAVADIADPKNDPIGLQLEEEHLPKRIRIPRQPKPPAGA